LLVSFVFLARFPEDDGTALVTKFLVTIIIAWMLVFPQIIKWRLVLVCKLGLQLSK
jgi:hypothetical protein